MTVGGHIPFLSLQQEHVETGVQDDIDTALLRVSRSGRYLLGPELEAFEAEYAAYCENSHCVAVGSGLDALTLTLRAMGIREGDEVIVPSHTCIASWLAVSAAGARPVPVEPQSGGFLLDPERLQAGITRRTRAIMPVHLYGHPVDLDAVEAVAADHGLPVIEDAAQAHGARYREKRIGARYAAAFSFYPSKNLGALSDGGAVVTSDAELAHRIRLLRNYASPETCTRGMQGVNSRLDELQAAVLRAKLPHLDRWNARRREIALRYHQGLSDIPAVQTPTAEGWAEPVWHQYVIRSAQRDRLRNALAAAGVETLVHYPVAVHRMGVYKARSCQCVLPLAEGLAAEVLSLPIGPHVNDDTIDAVMRAVRKAAEEL
ncbi:DegT/DnrJ/EryC1/StrS family aminotransferase (plasmid) [Streptomyces sp. CA-142005]|uniref:DegT/DnrJ/EryC1/StrS family aminotransferase n=1 Tax=Streptomyces sp. CA-142005 TaxID=3240052 RepID=UPI003D8F0EE4